MEQLNKFGLTVRELTPEYKDEIFRVLSPVLAPNEPNKSQLSRKKRSLKRSIEYTFNEEKHIAIGILKNGVLIGAALCNSEDNQPWIGYSSILKDHRNSRAMVLMYHYICNVLYRNRMVQLRPGKDMSTYKSLIISLPKMMNISIINPNTAERMSKIVNGE